MSRRRTICHFLFVTYFVQTNDNRHENKRIFKKNGQNFNSGFDELKSISDNLSIPLIIYLHANKLELKEKKYNEEGEEIINWSIKNNIKVIQEIDYNFSESDYRDGIHLNNNGQRKLANIMNEHLK